MPLHMVHLGVAHRLLQDHAIQDIPAFYLGNIAPDAVHCRPGSTREDKSACHLFDQDRQAWRCNALDFLQSYAGSPQADYYTGYGVHLLTDIYWNTAVFSRFKQQYSQDPDNLPDARNRAYYNDTDQLDFLLFASEPYRPAVWAQLALSRAFSVPGTVSGDEVEAWKERALHWFDSGQSLHRQPLRYIRYEDLQTFMDETARILQKDLAGLR